MTISSYEKLEDALYRIDLASNAAECHGAVSAMVCTMGEKGKDSFIDLALPELTDKLSQGDALAQEAQQIILDVYQQTTAQLLEGGFDYQLLLPDDEETLALRAQALGHWCQGFMMGLKWAGVTEAKSLPGDLAEIMVDIAEISKVGGDHLNETEEEEQSYAELVEYLRVGVMLFSEEFQPYVEEQPPNTLH